MLNKKVFLLVGKSASGKDTLMNMLLSDFKEIKPLVSHTTRPMRTGEEDGKTYHFVDDSTFEKMIDNDEFLETTSYTIESENKIYKYGLSKKEVMDTPYAMTIVNPYGLNELSKSEFKDNIVSILITRDDKDRILAYINRDENVNIKEMIDRYKRDEEDFKDVVADYILENDDSICSSYIKLYKLIKEEIEEE